MRVFRDMLASTQQRLQGLRGRLARNVGSRLPVLLLGLLAVALLGLTGCQETPAYARHAIINYQMGQFEQAAAHLQPEIKKTNEDFVLNNCRYGSAALAAGNLQGAEDAFLAAYEVINGVKTNSGGRTLGATLVFEGVKVWKGEPFERAMTHYYLGLIYLIKNDYGNARAAFQNSLFKLREYESDKEHVNEDRYRDYESNFALGYLGLGICYQRMGETQLAQANFQRAAALRPNLTGVVQAMQNPKTNTLIFVDWGMGPRRAGKGWYNEESAFGPTPGEAGPVPSVQAYADGHPLVNFPCAATDTLAMAQDQKWQDIDTIKKTKAVIGTGLIAAGAGTAMYGSQRNNPQMALVGLGIMAVGAAVAASSQSDLRYWELLPRTVYAIPATLPPGQHMLDVNVGYSGVRSFPVTIKAQGDNVFYIRLQ